MKEYGTDPKLDELVESYDWKNRIKAADQGYGLDKLVNDKDWNVRYAVAMQGYDLDKLVYDEHWHVREAAEKYLKEHNYKSVFDWAKDNNVDIDLDEWLNSNDWIKKYNIAKQGYCLDKLVYDEDSDVRAAAYSYLKEHNYKSIIEWAKDNNIDINIDKLLNSDDWTKRYAVAKQGYRLDKLVNDEDEDVRCVVAEQGYGLDKLVYDENYSVRDAVYNYLNEHNYKSVLDWAKNNNVDIDIDEWLNSDNYIKRLEVAKQGYRLDKLIYDEDRNVRYTVARQGYRLDIFVNDENNYVRRAVARQGYGLDKLVYDEDYEVRKAVASQGYNLDILSNDEECDVRDAVDVYLKEHNLTLNEWCIQNNKSPVIIQNLKDFIYKVEDSSKIKVETSYDSVEAFFEDMSDESYENRESIVLVTVDTKIPLIKLEKTRIENKNCFKFIVDISNKNDDFIIRSIFDTKEEFDQFLQSTINALYRYSQFSKYAEELEQYL